MDEANVTVKDIAIALSVPAAAILARSRVEEWPAISGSGMDAVFRVAELPDQVRPLVAKHILKVLRSRPTGDEYTISQLVDFFERPRSWVESRAKEEEWPFEIQSGRKVFKLSDISKQTEKRNKKIMPQNARENIIRRFEKIELVAEAVSQEVSCILKALRSGAIETVEGLNSIRNRAPRLHIMRQLRANNIRRSGVVD
jgi:hypothetical protein